MAFSKSELQDLTAKAAEAGFAYDVKYTGNPATPIVPVYSEPMKSAFMSAIAWKSALGGEHKQQITDAMKCAAGVAWEHKHAREIPGDMERYGEVVKCAQYIAIPSLEKQFEALNDAAKASINGILRSVYDEAFEMTPRDKPIHWAWWVAGGVATVAVAGGVAWYFNKLPSGWNREDTGMPRLPSRSPKMLAQHNPVKREYERNSVPKGQIQWLVGRMSVGETDETVRKDIEDRVRRSVTPDTKKPWPDYFVKWCGDYAVQCHHKNQGLYNDVMSGRIGSGSRRRKSNPTKGSAVAKHGGYVWATTYETWDEESLEIGETDDKGWEHEYEDHGPYQSLADLLQDIPSHSWLEWSASRPRPGSWIISEDDQDYRSGDRTQYSLHIKHADGSDLTQSEIDFVDSKIFGRRR